jgi:UDP-N-acetylmuramoylalanine--D-glutamate ligase
VSETPWRNALVIGLGASGRAAADLLLALGVHVRGYDRQSPADLPLGLEPFLGAELPPPEAFADLDLMVLSPGVPPRAFREAAARHAPRAQIHGELGLGLALVHAGARPGWQHVPTALITGTNGKSTVTALVGELLRAAGRDPFVGGNLGSPLCGRLADHLAGRAPWPTDLVLECSSYQLETLPVLPTQVGIVLNVTPDHLDRYDSMEAYARTKARVFAGLGDDGLAILHADDPFTPMITPAHGRVALVGRDARIEGEGEAQRLVVGTEVHPRARLAIRGRHNAENALFALLAAQQLGTTAEARARALAAFEGLPHRMVLVRELNGVQYYDDSKATNVASALASLGGLDRPFVLIAGGLAKGDDLAPLAELLRARGRGLVAIGRDGPQFVALGRGIVPTRAAASVEEAVALARAMAHAGEAVVLAPACASFDQFRSYAHRGEVFTAAVHALAPDAH